ncbi:type VII secretion integral membrane protein EccD [Mycobacterium timonense]|uniref:ESX-4 secretion system protein eccD4 n=1 Tax=Mycobacterium timonense TaxID=701043 RepID=A0A7I9Z9K6_9MYCO|nr:type VII secretion integral membrane protein EccD [Mycobacterium timonense]GFG97643.1 ESX-4 secretion system protein eccD4 [Mycobacterium timonense]
MAASEAGLCRVCIYWGATAADLALPAEVPVAVLIPSVVDALEVRHPDQEAMRYQLSVPGASALDASTTLAQNRIGDGAVLVLSRPGVPLPAPRYVDVAHEVSATLEGAARPRGDDGNRRVARLCGAAAAVVVSAVGGLALLRNVLGASHPRDVAALGSAAIVALGLAAIAHRVYRDAIAGLALSVIATVFAAVAGFLVVPGAPSVSNVLLAGAAAAAAAVLGMRLSGCGVVALTAAACFAAVIAAAALVGTISAAPVHVVASAAGVLSLGLLAAAPRVSIALAGLSPRWATSEVADCEPSDSSVSARAVRADRWLVSLRAGLSASAGVGAVVTVLAGAPRPSCLVFGAVTAAVLLLRCGSGDSAGLTGFAVSGIVTAATTFGVAAVLIKADGPTLVAATALVAAAMYLGFAATASSPVVLRCAEALEWLAWAALVPLACWIGGLYAAVRGMNLT